MFVSLLLLCAKNVTTSGKKDPEGWIELAFYCYLLYDFERKPAVGRLTQGAL